MFDEDKCSLYSMGVIQEYVDLHSKSGFAFDKRVADSIIQIKGYFSERHDVKTVKFTKESFFQGNKGGYKDLVMARRSLRDFGPDNIEISKVMEAVDLATECPSACNRQPYRVYAITDGETIKEIMSIQQGNSGFGYLANKVLLVTSDISVFGGGKERHEVFINGGIFLNSLVNSLYYYSIGSCILNWSVEPKRDRMLRRLISFPAWESVIALVAIGAPKDVVGVPLSTKVKSDKILTVM